MRSSSSSGVRVSSFGLGVRVDGLQVVVLGFDLLPGDRPAALAVGALGQQAEELLEWASTVSGVFLPTLMSERS